VPAAGSDRVAEAALGCLLRLLERWPPAGWEEVQDLVPRLVTVLQLPASATSEEPTAVTLRCIAAALQALQQPNAPGPGSRAAGSTDDAIAGAGAGAGAGTSPYGVGLPAGLADLGGRPQGELDRPAVALLGFVVSTCLQAAEQQVMAAQQGSQEI